ncbi:hypothetical protein FRC02_002177 [Tulasnella sp. 418]|nr:hypothetical protein FRC02_002177 [Tulasnella sp. 418]
MSQESASTMVQHQDLEKGSHAAQHNFDPPEAASTLVSRHRPRKDSPAPSVTIMDSPTAPHPVHAIANGSHEQASGQGAAPPGAEESPHVGILRRLSTLMEPDKKIGPTPTVAASLKAIILSSWLNLMLVFIPVSWALHFTIDNDTIIFIFSFLAIIPLAKLLGFATEELALRVGQTIGGLLNATLGNAVELIISIIALTKCQLRVVQASLVGSILSNLLLVLGMCFFAGGTRFSEQGFMQGAAQINSSLLTVSVVAILIPATFHAAIGGNTSTESEGNISPQKEGQDILKMSRGVAIILLFIYGSMLFFQLWSHAHLYEEKGEHAGEAPPSIRYPPRKSKNKLLEKNPAIAPPPHPPAEVHLSPIDADTTHGSDLASNHNDEEEEQPQISVLMAAILLVVVTVLVAFTAEFLVSSIDGLVEHSPISEEWVGLILIPIVGNAAEHLTAVTVSVKDKLDLSIGVAVGSSIQISLLVIPLIVILGWIIGKVGIAHWPLPDVANSIQPLTLLFDPFEAVVLFLSVITVNYTVADGRSNWLEGMVLMSMNAFPLELRNKVSHSCFRPLCSNRNCALVLSWQVRWCFSSVTIELLAD